MNIRGLSLAEFTRITGSVSRLLYNGNLQVKDGSDHGSYFTARIGTRDSRGAGARTSASGRHGPYASWEAYRDVLHAMFRAHPDAVARTALATYRGLAGFLEKYPATGEQNIGSRDRPVTMPECTVRPGQPAPAPPELRIPPGYTFIHGEEVLCDFTCTQVSRTGCQCPECQEAPDDPWSDPVVFGPGEP